MELQMDSSQVMRRRWGANLVKNYKEMVSVATEATSFSFGDVFVYDIRPFSTSLREQNKLPVFFSEREIKFAWSFGHEESQRSQTCLKSAMMRQDTTKWKFFFVKIASGIAIVFWNQQNDYTTLHLENDDKA